jgi:hypothetical protein
MQLSLISAILTLLATNAFAQTPGAGRDANGCIPSAGYSWCPALNQCIRPWETACPSSPAPGSDRDANGCITSAGYSWCPALNQCIQPWLTTCPSSTFSESRVTVPTGPADASNSGLTISSNLFSIVAAIFGILGI